MKAIAWFIEHWSGIIESTGIIGSLLFAGFGYRRDARVRKAETLIEITKQHRELSIHRDDDPDLKHLRDADRDMVRRPLTTKEAHEVSFLINHLRATFYAQAAGIYVQPEKLREDIKNFLSLPAPKAAWNEQKKYHDADFVAFVEKSC